MPAQPLSPAVAEFLARHIRSVEELHVLIAVLEGGDRWWDASTTSRELRISTNLARRLLDRLAQQNLLDIRITDEVRYQFHPGTAALKTAARACVDAYRDNPIAVHQAITGRGRRGLRDFADAFRIRRDDDDDR